MDYPATIDITVTQEDIDKGEPFCSTGCPIYYAALRAFDNRDLCVGPFHINLLSGDRMDTLAEYILPEDATSFILNFDNEHGVSPFSFTATLRD